MIHPSIAIEASIAPKISFATQQNAISILRDLRLANHGDDSVSALEIRVSASPPIFAEKRWIVDHIAPRGAAHITDRDLPLNPALLVSLTEAVEAVVAISARVGDELVAASEIPVRILARHEWGGATAMPELLAAFVQPNDPAIDRLLRAAADFLSQAGKPASFNGYELRSRERAWETASAIWSAVRAQGIAYALPPASFETQGQKIRTPSQILDGGVATCLDTALLFAAAFEQAGLNPIVVLTNGHAFTGVWLQPQEFSQLISDEAMAVRKHIALQELLVFETTLATQANATPFTAAIEAGVRQISEEREHEFVMAFDLRRARMQGLRPLAHLADGLPAYKAATQRQTPASAMPLEEAPPLPAAEIAEDAVKPETPEGRLDRWRRKLLDLTVRNRLLHLRPGASSVELVCPDAAKLEDMLADGRRFRICPMPSLEGAAGRDLDLLQQQTGRAAALEYAHDALQRNEVLSPLDKDKLEAQLVALYRKARLDFAEGGANTLFLAIGFLRWRKNDGDKRAYLAPLILLPVQLERRSVRSGIRLKQHDDEPRFNMTLLQLLRQDFNLEIPELADALPKDSSGVDVAQVWRLMRNAVRDMQGFEVVENVVLGTFSFAKYLLWRDLVDRTETLQQNPIVRHLLETPREPYTQSASPPDPRTLDDIASPETLFTPLPLDSSQLAAVVASQSGCDFVLDGPPGTGKSQTIANIIAHNLAQGRKVLFVAEKRAALEVVYRRLQSNGLGAFCLELHSNKANKAEVIKQLGAAWTESEAADTAQWERVAAALKQERDTLNQVVRQLHKRHPNGQTLYKAIGRVVRDKAKNTPTLRWPDDVEHSEQDFLALTDAAKGLDVVWPPVSGFDTETFGLVGQTDWSPVWQAELLTAAAQLSAASAGLEATRAAMLRALGVQDAAGETRIAEDASALKELTELAEALPAAAEIDLSFAFAKTARETLRCVREAIPLIERYQTEAAALTVAQTIEAVRTLPLDSLAADWAKANKAIWPLSVFWRASVRKRLTPPHAAARPDPAADLPRLADMRAVLLQLAGYEAAAAAPGWRDAESDKTALLAALRTAVRIRNAAARLAQTPAQRSQFLPVLRRACTERAEELDRALPLGRSTVEFSDAYEQWAAARAAFEQLSKAAIPTDGPDLLARIQALCAVLRAKSAGLNLWCAWRRAYARAAQVGLAPIADALQNGTLQEKAASTFETAYADWWSSQLINHDPLLRSFTAHVHMDRILQFRKHDDELAELTHKYIRARLCSQIPAKDSPHLEPGLRALRHQLTLTRPRKALRELISELGAALNKLAPCLLMSPLSVAQYLPADLPPFDLVIFDEASQITPWDAVGAIARGRQVIVAGDPKQMPPTSFFDKSAGSDSFDDDAEEDQESILDECLAAGVTSHRLTWHYRSKNENLIAFSNHRYYDGDLITFPAPVTRNIAVRFVRVHGAWSRGRLRTNQIEAEAIVAETVRRLTDPGFTDEHGKRLSLAIVTLNAEQQKLVEDLLDKARQENPEIEPFFAEDHIEPTIVKNLETVQGDERDLIILGIGYGPETPGAPSMSMNLGPLNRNGGWRRLNVAITRARREMMVFSSFAPHLLDLNRTSARAVRDLKHFPNSPSVAHPPLVKPYQARWVRMNLPLSRQSRTDSRAEAGR